MGFIILIPFAALAGWCSYRICRWLYGGGFGPEWRRAFKLVALAGVALGIWFVFFTAYNVANTHLTGFPIPVEILSREKPEDPWVKSVLPPPVRAGAAVTDMLIAVMLCLAPLALAAFIKQNKGHQDFSGSPRADKSP